MKNDYDYTYDKTMLTSKTVGKIIKIANALALNITPHLKERLPVIKELEILNKDRKQAMETSAFLRRRKVNKQ